MRRIPGMPKSLPLQITGGPQAGKPNASQVPQPTCCILLPRASEAENLASRFPLGLIFCTECCGLFCSFQIP